MRASSVTLVAGDVTQPRRRRHRHLALNTLTPHPSPPTPHPPPGSLMYHPPREGPAVFRSNVNNATLELPGPGLAYVAAPKNYTALGLDMTGRNDSKEETGVNSAGVSVSATETIFNSKGALAADPYLEDTGLIEDVLASVLLDQASSGAKLPCAWGGCMPPVCSAGCAAAQQAG